MNFHKYVCLLLSLVTVSPDDSEEAEPLGYIIILQTNLSDILLLFRVWYSTLTAEVEIFLIFCFIFGVRC